MLQLVDCKRIKATMTKQEAIKLFLTILLFSLEFPCMAQISNDSIVADFRHFIEYLEETHPAPYTNYGGKSPVSSFGAYHFPNVERGEYNNRRRVLLADSLISCPVTGWTHLYQLPNPTNRIAYPCTNCIPHH